MPALFRSAVLLAGLLAALPAVAQSPPYVLTAEVRDARTGETLPGASVLVEGTGFGASTDL